MKHQGLNKSIASCKQLTLGSLFDGSGGFPLAATLLGITPLWASEIEPFAIGVTSHNFPNMKHYGDVSQINGGEIEPVDIITFGFPCQNLSTAGGRDGLVGSKSKLFYEAIRIIKEMRVKTNGEYPKYIVLENVMGLLSSNSRQDFRIALEQICRIVDETAEVPLPKRRWSYAGEILGGDYSVSWRTLNSKYFGVPQRRRRVFVVGCFGNRPKTSSDVLFKSEGFSGYSTESFKIWQRTACGYIERARETGKIAYTLRDRAGKPGGGKGPLVQHDLVGTIQVSNDQYCFSPINLDDGSLSDDYVARRLTPIEYGRLQGFPDWWCNGVDTRTDKQCWQLWGNGIALPCVLFILAGIVWAEKTPC